MILLRMHMTSPELPHLCRVWPRNKRLVDLFFENTTAQGLLSVGVLAVSIFLAVIFFLITRFVSRRLGSGRAHLLAATVVRSISLQGALFFVVSGILISFALLPNVDTKELEHEVQQIGTIALLIIGARVLTNVFSVSISWYVANVAPRTTSRFDDTILPIIRRFLSVAIYLIGGLIILDMLGISISPLLGGLGITGLAVALALQPTLSNFFSGAYVLSEGMISVGDYIELQGGPAGYVVDIGWRSTRIRTWLNNYVLIPNSKMSDTIITNYSGPDPRINTIVTCGVSYDCNLEEVNRIALEVAENVVEGSDFAVKTEKPWFGYENFNDSNVDFWIYIQAKDRIGSFMLTSDLIKKLHQRFIDEGIEINYPIRKIISGDLNSAKSNNSSTTAQESN
ncbi:MAG: mechanosensitive ion channel family protein [SAR202 cluster bacterium]|nr:mechanosensitive ion channel family protein [SAR202 cluster bacterium]